MLGRDTSFAAQLEAFADDYVALVDKHVDAALFVCVRQDGRRAAPYGLSHALHTATVAWLCAHHLGWARARALRRARGANHERRQHEPASADGRAG